MSSLRWGLYVISVCLGDVRVEGYQTCADSKRLGDVRGVCVRVESLNLDGFRVRNHPFGNFVYCCRCHLDKCCLLKKCWDQLAFIWLIGCKVMMMAASGCHPPSLRGRCPALTAMYLGGFDIPGLT